MIENGNRRLVKSMEKNRIKKIILAGVVSSALAFSLFGCSKDTQKEEQEAREKAMEDPLTAMQFGEEPSYNPNEYPDYIVPMGYAYDIINKDMPEKGEIAYEKISYNKNEDKNRTIKVLATITADMIDKSVEPTLTMDPPCTSELIKKNEKIEYELVDGSTHNGALWVDFKLLGTMLGGEDILDNKVIGTYAADIGNNDLNGGLLSIENEIQDYLRAYPYGYVYYTIEPKYAAGENIPRGFIVNVKSDNNPENLYAVEDLSSTYRNKIDAGGKFLCNEYYIYNTAAGYDLNYVDGSYEKTTDNDDPFPNVALKNSKVEGEAKSEVKIGHLH